MADHPMDTLNLVNGDTVDCPREAIFRPNVVEGRSGRPLEATRQQFLGVLTLGRLCRVGVLVLRPVQCREDASVITTVQGFARPRGQA